MAEISFLKMHGAGNDFVVIDGRNDTIAMTPELAGKLAARRLGIGCDQLVVMKSSNDADIYMQIFNSDGSEIEACGNATRCIGWLMMQETGKDKICIETQAGLLTCRAYGDAQVSVDMGEPKVQWHEIPLSEARNTEHLGIAEGKLMDPTAINLGNPHMVFFVSDIAHVKLDQQGPVLEYHPLFPQRANISAAEVVAEDHVKAAVWERGSGLTLACGTAACAIVVAGVKRGLLDRKATVSLPGGDLIIEWLGNNHVQMTGPVAKVYEGTVDTELL